MVLVAVGRRVGDPVAYFGVSFISAPLPVTEIINGYYGEIQKMGGGRWDTSSLIRRFKKA